MKLKERLAAVSAEAQEIITLAEKGHPLTEADTKRLNDLREEATGLRARIEAVEGAGDFFKSLGNPAAGAQEQEKQVGVPAAKSLGEIAVKNFTETGVLTNISEHRKANSDFMFKQGEGPVVSGPGKTVTTTNVVGTHLACCCLTLTRTSSSSTFSAQPSLTGWDPAPLPATRSPTF